MNQSLLKATLRYLQLIKIQNVKNRISILLKSSEATNDQKPLQHRH